MDLFIQSTIRTKAGISPCIQMRSSGLKNGRCYSIFKNVNAYTQGIGLYRKNAIAIESEAGDPNDGNVYYVTMQITFHIPEFARNKRNLHCDVVHITTVWVSRLVLDHAIAAIQTWR